MQFCLPRGMKISQEMNRWFSQAGALAPFSVCFHVSIYD